MFIASKLKIHVAAGRQIMPGARPYQHWPRQPGQEYFTHGQAANGFIHRRDHDTGGAFGPLTPACSWSWRNPSRSLNPWTPRRQIADVGPSRSFCNIATPYDNLAVHVEAAVF
ncbi:MAG: hypothetical protein WCC90_13100 [Methylocella sp.]